MDVGAYLLSSLCGAKDTQNWQRRLDFLAWRGGFTKDNGIVEAGGGGLIGVDVIEPQPEGLAILHYLL